MGILSNVIPNKLNPSTGENLYPTVVTTWRDGSTITDAHCGGMYNKDTEPSSITNGKYFKWNSAGAYPVSRLTTVNQSNLQKLINDFGDIPSVIVLDKSVDITSNLTIPSNVSISWMVGAVFNISSGVTLTINSPITVGNQQLFSGQGNVTGNMTNVNIKWFGAKGDGITDDYLTLTKAISCVNTIQQSLFIPKGSYYIKLQNTISLSSKVTISGEEGTILNLDTNTPTFTNFIRNNGNNVIVKNLEINRIVDQPFVIIQVQAFSNFTIDNVKINGNRDTFNTNYCHAFQMGINNSGISDYTKILNCTITKVSYGLFMTNSSTATVRNVRVANCIFDSNTSSDLEFNSPLGTFSNVTVRDCRFLNGQLFGVGFAFIKSGKVLNCYFEGYNEESIHIEDYSEDILIEGNTFKSCALVHYAYVQIISGARRIRISNNTFDATSNTASTNIVNALQGGVGNTPGGRIMIPPLAISFVNNDVFLSSTINGLYLETITNFLVNNNKFRGTGGVNSGTFSGSNNYCIRTYASQFGEICNNDFRGINTCIAGLLNTVNSLAEGMLLSNNTFSNSLIGIAAYNAFPSTISNNVFIQCQYSILTGKYSTGTPKSLLIYGNNAIRCTNPMLIYNYVKVTATVSATIGTGKTVTISPLAGTLPSGTVITFASGAVLTLTAAALFQSTTLTGDITVANIAAADTATVYRAYSNDTTQLQTVFKNTDDYYGRSGLNFIKEVSADYQVVGYEEVIFITANTPTIKLPPAISWNTSELVVRNGSGSNASVTYDGTTDTINAGTVLRYRLNEAGNAYIKY